MLNSFSQQVLSVGSPGMSVLDVGAHVFKSSIAFRDAGFKVTALDIQPQPNCPEGIACITADFMTWKPNQQYDILYMRNSAQFMSKVELLEKLKQMSPWIIAVETFYGPPQPPFERQHLMTYYEPIDFHFDGYKVLLAEKIEHEGPDMKGNTRVFKLTRHIGVKN